MYYNCNNNCRVCKCLIFSDSVTVVAIDGVDTLVIDIPLSPFGSYRNCERYCLVITQAIPDTATINMPVAISIGGDTTTVYPLVRCNCAQVTACAIRTRTRYPVLVSTNATGGVFKVLRGLSCCPNNNLATLPVPATAGGGAVAEASEPVVTPAYSPETASNGATTAETTSATTLSTRARKTATTAKEGV